MTTWHTPDTYRPSNETAAVDAAIDAAEDVDRLLTAGGRAMHAALATLRTWEPGTRAAAYDRKPQGPPMWCDHHERDLRHCEADDLCTGVPYQPGADPVGEAAVTEQRGRDDRGELIRLLRQRARLDRRIVAIVEPTQQHKNRCCTNTACRRPLRPTDLNADGRPRYTLWCRPCGDWEARYGSLPPKAITSVWIAGGTVTREMREKVLGSPRRPKVSR